MARIPIYPQNSLNTYILFFFLQVLHQHNDTLLRLEAASKSAYSYALGITVGLGGILCFLNGMLLLCLCQKRSSRKRNASQCEPTTSIGNNNNLFLHYFFTFFLLEILTTFLNRFSASAADYLASSQPPTPQVHFHSSSLSRTTTMPRGQRAAVMLTSGSGQQNQYRTFHATRYVTY